MAASPPGLVRAHQPITHRSLGSSFPRHKLGIWAYYYIQNFTELFQKLFCFFKLKRQTPTHRTNGNQGTSGIIHPPTKLHSRPRCVLTLTLPLAPCGLPWFQPFCR